MSFLARLALRGEKTSASSERMTGRGEKRTLRGNYQHVS